MRRATHSLTRPLILVQAAVGQIKHIVAHKLMAARAGRNRPIQQPAYFFPEYPHPYTVCYRTLHKLGIKPVHGWPTPQTPGLVFVWKDDTYVPAPSTHELNQAAGSRLVNGACLDISKERVDAIHQQVLGYALAVDPTTFTGRMVIKSNLNGAHDGLEVVGPLASPSSDSVYQRVVNNRPKKVPAPLVHRDVVCDIRVTIFGSQAGFAYLKYRPIESRFSNANSLVELIQLPDVFSAQEIEQIEVYCLACGLDYGEIDVVRDANDGRIYILDINKTPLGPPNGLPDTQCELAIEMYCQAFRAWFERLGLPGVRTQASEANQKQYSRTS
jgi:hypothetical protein